MFRVREGPSPRLLRANVNGENWWWASFLLALTMDSRFSNLTVIEKSGGSSLFGKQPMKSKSWLFNIINPNSKSIG